MPQTCNVAQKKNKWRKNNAKLKTTAQSKSLAKIYTFLLKTKAKQRVRQIK